MSADRTEGPTPKASDEWQPIETAPRSGPVVEIEGRNGERVELVHWAYGGGEDQPRFGPAWFYPIYDGTDMTRVSYYNEMIPPPTHWRAKSRV